MGHLCGKQEHIDKRDVHPSGTVSDAAFQKAQASTRLIQDCPFVCACGCALQPLLQRLTRETSCAGMASVRSHQSLDSDWSLNQVTQGLKTTLHVGLRLRVALL